MRHLREWRIPSRFCGWQRRSKIHNSTARESPRLRSLPQIQPKGNMRLRHAVLRAGGHRPGYWNRPRSIGTWLVVYGRAQFGPGIRVKRIPRLWVARPQIRHFIRLLGLGVRQHPAQTFLDDGPQGPPGFPRMALGAYQQLVVQINSRFHSPILAIQIYMGKQHNRWGHGHPCRSAGKAIR